MTIVRFVLATTLALLAGCASAPAFRTTLEPGAEPARLRSFVFVARDPAAADTIADPLAQRRLQQLVARQLAARGYVGAAPGQAAEIGVAIGGRAQPRSRVLIGAGAGAFDVNSGQIDAAAGRAIDYREGVLDIELVDLARGRPLWRAHIEETLTPGYAEENWQRLERALDGAFRELPPHR